MTLAAVGFGGNLGDVEGAFADALAALGARWGVERVATSSLWRSAPWGPVPQPEFLNAVALFRTSGEPRAFLDLLLEEERRAGRVRRERWGPRTLDLDLLFFGATVVAEPGLEVPHPQLAERSFVLEPLAEVAPAWRDPRTGLSVSKLLEALRGSDRWTPCDRIEASCLGRRDLPEAACRK